MRARVPGESMAVRKKVGIKAKFAVLFIATAVVLLAVNAVWRDSVQHGQVEREMLESAHMLATEMNAVWDFMEVNQSQFVRNEDGTYNVYCVVAAKVVAQKFTNSSDGIIIHYTNIETRKPADAPDEYELEALYALRDNPSSKAYYGLVDYRGSKAFRYVEPLWMAESCLECHGGPEGELDVMGFPKEGREVGDLAGAASIIIPADTYLAGAQESALRETLVFFLFLASCMLVAFYGVSRLVTRPLRKLGAVSEKLEQHDFDVNLDGIGQYDEMEELAQRFDSMARELKTLYEHLEAEVDLRTAQIVESNKVLEHQRVELENMNRMLQRDNELKEDFLATVSHEMRTPLTSILAFVDIWEQTNTPRNSDEKKIMGEMKFSSQVLLSMVNNMLDLSRIEAGRTELSLGPVDIADLLGIVRDGVTFLAEKKAASITIAVDENVPVVMTDCEKLRRIVENLASNAVKFIDVGGRVCLNGRYSDDSRELTLAVTDDGCGIDPGDIPFLFERFVKGSNVVHAVGRSYGSSGLGLALVKDLTGLLGGTVEVESRIGQGSTFTVTLPVEPVDTIDE